MGLHTHSSGSHTCADAIPNCSAYGREACQDPYRGWATENCARYCGLCGGGGGEWTLLPCLCSATSHLSYRTGHHAFKNELMVERNACHNETFSNRGEIRARWSG